MVAAHRQSRPWTAAEVAPPPPPPPAYVPSCHLCPGNLRISGRRNPDYAGVHVFDNDHPCVGPEAPDGLPPPPRPYRRSPARGVARVICYSPRHDLALAQLPPASAVALVEAWQAQMREFAARPDIRHVLIFENKGEVVGVSNPHPHGQLYATTFVFKTIETEARVCQEHLRAAGRPLFQEILAAELDHGGRMVAESGHSVAFIPWFARYAYEVHVAPRATRATVADLSPAEAEDFAVLLQNVCLRLDNLWRRPFPYVMVLHQAPLDGADHTGFHVHIEFHPPLRTPNLLKYLAGPEIGGGNFLSDTDPDEKAAELRACPSVHYLAEP